MPVNGWIAAAQQPGGLIIGTDAPDRVAHRFATVPSFSGASAHCPERQSACPQHGGAWQSRVACCRLLSLAVA
jgi:hypothetical protein